MSRVIISDNIMQFNVTKIVNDEVVGISIQRKAILREGFNLQIESESVPYTTVTVGNETYLEEKLAKLYFRDDLQRIVQHLNSLSAEERQRRIAIIQIVIAHALAATALDTLEWNNFFVFDQTTYDLLTKNFPDLGELLIYQPIADYGEFVPKGNQVDDKNKYKYFVQFKNIAGAKTTAKFKHIEYLGATNTPNTPIEIGLDKMKVQLAKFYRVLTIEGGPQKQKDGRVPDFISQETVEVPLLMPNNEDNKAVDAIKQYESAARAVSIAKAQRSSLRGWLSILWSNAQEIFFNDNIISPLEQKLVSLKPKDYDEKKKQEFENLKKADASIQPQIESGARNLYIARLGKTYDNQIDILMAAKRDQSGVKDAEDKKQWIMKWLENAAKEYPTYAATVQEYITIADARYNREFAPASAQEQSPRDVQKPMAEVKQEQARGESKEAEQRRNLAEEELLLRAQAEKRRKLDEEELLRRARAEAERRAQEQSQRDAATRERQSQQLQQSQQSQREIVSAQRTELIAKDEQILGLKQEIKDLERKNNELKLLRMAKSDNPDTVAKIEALQNAIINVREEKEKEIRELQADLAQARAVTADVQQMRLQLLHAQAQASQAVRAQAQAQSQAQALQASQGSAVKPPRKAIAEQLRAALAAQRRKPNDPALNADVKRLIRAYYDQ
jgi:hypothetical protein